MPYDPAIAFGYCQQAAEILRQHVAQRDADNKYRLIANGGDDGYEQDLQEIHCRMANCSERLINQAPPAEKRAAYEKTFSIISIWPPAMAISGPGNSFCLILRRKDLALAHSHLQQVREAANKGSPEAMVALSQLYSNKRDKALYNMKQSARWAHFSSPCTLNMNYSWIWMLSISILSGNAGALPGTPHASLIPSCRGRSTPWCKVVYSPAPQRYNARP